MRFQYFLNSISSPKVNSCSSLPLLENCKQKQLANKQVKQREWSNISKGELWQLGMETVVPSYTRKRNQRGRIVDTFCHHKIPNNSQYHENNFDYMRKGEGSFSTWELRKRKGKEQRLYRREYERYTYQPSSYSSESKSTVIHEYRKQIAEKKVRHKFCQFFKIRCCKGKCRLQCYNELFEYYLQRQNLMEEVSKIVEKGAELDENLKSQIMVNILGRSGNVYSEEMIKRINDIIVKKYGKNQKEQEKYQNWGRSMGGVIAKLGRYKKKVSDIEGYQQECSNSDKFLDEKLLQYTINKQKQKNKNSQRKKQQQLNLQTENGNKNYDDDRKFKGAEQERILKDDGEVLKSRKIKIKRKNADITKQGKQPPSDNTTLSPTDQLITNKLELPSQNKCKIFNSTSLSSNHRKIRKQHFLAKTGYSSALRKKNIERWSHHNRNIANNQISVNKEKQINKANNDMVENLQKIQIVSVRPSQTLLRVEQQSNRQSQKNDENISFSKNYRNIRNHKILQISEQSKNDIQPQNKVYGDKKVIKKIKISMRDSINRSIIQGQNTIFGQLEQEDHTTDEKCYKSGNGQQQNCKYMRSNKLVKKGQEQKKSTKQIASQNGQQQPITNKELQNMQYTEQIPKISSQLHQQNPIPKLPHPIHIPILPQLLFSHIQAFLNKIGLSFAIISSKDSLLTQKRKIIYLSTLVKQKYITTNVGEILQYIWVFAKIGNIQWLVNRMGENICCDNNNINNQTTNTLFTPSDISDLAHKQNILKFYTLKSHQIISNKQNFFYRQIHPQQHLTRSSNQSQKFHHQWFSNEPLFTNLQMHITYKQQIPFDFYHYWNLGLVVGRYRYRKERGICYDHDGYDGRRCECGGVIQESGTEFENQGIDL